MKPNGKLARRSFLKIMPAAALAAMAGYSFKSKAALMPARIILGHFSDTVLDFGGGEKQPKRIHSGWLYEHANSLTGDLVAQLKQNTPPVDFLAHSGRVMRRKKSEIDFVREFGLEGVGCGLVTPCNYFSEERNGFLFIFLADESGVMHPEGARLFERKAQLDWLKQTLAQSAGKPAVLVAHPPLIPTPVKGFAKKDFEELVKIMRANSNIVLALCGKALGNYAGFVENTDALCLVTASPAIYPCGCRVIEMSADAEGRVKVDARFIQTRLLDLVEESYHQAGDPRLLPNIGRREERTLTVSLPEKELKQPSYPLANLAPVWPGRDEFTLAVFSDIHVCDDRFLTDKDRSEFKLIGHFAEQGSKAIFADLLEQAEAGKHRVEFYDRAFERDPQSDLNFVLQPVDGLLICGDLAENGRKEESEFVRASLDRLPRGLKQNTMLALGNHDMHSDFAPDGPASSRAEICAFYGSYIPGHGKGTYIRHLNEWLTLIVLDGVTATRAIMGLGQEQIDWLDDMLAALKDRAVIIASHHTLYHLSLVPEAMYGYMRQRSNFTPKKSAARDQLHDIFARHNNVKLLISGHYHGVVADQFRKDSPEGSGPDDAWTTHVQVPCSVEYPNGYRLFKVSRQGTRGRIEYATAYTRLSGLRKESAGALLYRALGTKAKPSKKYLESLDSIARQDNFNAAIARLDPFDPVDLNLRGFKDGTANMGRGNSGKININGKIEFTI